ncbi:MAG: c-type cytochrome biogenesis protein CcsB [Candidatus Nanopelagicales bacterium]
MRREDAGMTSAESMGLAEASNAAIYATMVTLSIAMVLFAASFASGRRPSTVASQVVGTGGSVAVMDRPEPRAYAEPGRKLANVAMSLTWLATGLLTLALVLRGIWAGRVPWGNMYEFSISSAWGVLVVFLAISTRRDLRWLGLFVVAPALLTLGLAVTVLYTEAAQLVPALKSYWLVIHVSAAIICAGAFTVAASSAALSLVQSRHERLGRVWHGPMSNVPSAEKLQTFTSRLIAFSFPLWTFSVIAGAIWAENAWGRYWGWDPKETWALITWLVYAAYLHARSTAGWRGDKASWIAILGLVTFLINYFGVNIFVNSLHSYAGL